MACFKAYVHRVRKGSNSDIIVLYTFLFMTRSDTSKGQYAKSACKTITVLVFVASKLLPYFNVVRAHFGKMFTEEETGNSGKRTDRKKRFTVGRCIICTVAVSGGRTVALGLTQPLKERSVRNISWG
jgi:hypothetical protein